MAAVPAEALAIPVQTARVGRVAAAVLGAPLPTAAAAQQVARQAVRCASG